MSNTLLRTLMGVCLTCAALDLTARPSSADVAFDVDKYEINVDLDTPSANDVIVDFGDEFVTVIVNDDDIVIVPINFHHMAVSIQGSEYRDTLHITGYNPAGRVQFYGHGGNDRCDNNSAVPAEFVGGKGRDVLDGGPGHDFFFGGPGDDEAHGRGGDDILVGDQGADVLVGGGGDDRIIGGIFVSFDGEGGVNTIADFSVDLLTGGSGCDTFYYTYYDITATKSSGGLPLVKKYYYDTDLVADAEGCDKLIETYRAIKKISP